MISKYLESLQALFEAIKTGRDFTFLDYLTTIGLTISLMAMIVVVVIAVIAMCVGPKKVYNKFMADLEVKAGEIIASKIYGKEWKELEKKIRNRKIMFAIGIVTLYLPIVIPTILYLCYLIFHI